MDERVNFSLASDFSAIFCLQMSYYGMLMFDAKP